MADISSLAETYFSTMNPLAAKISEDINEAKNAYENIWETLTEKEKTEIINESIIKPEIVLKYALLDTLDFDLNDPPVRKDDLMSFFGREHGIKIVQDEVSSWRDEHSAPFLFQTKSQLNLCALSECRTRNESKSPPPVMSELAMSHSKVVSELKNALKSQKIATYRDTNDQGDGKVMYSPTGLINKLIGNKFRSKDEDKEKLMNVSPQAHIVASSENFFRTNFKSPAAETKFEKDYRSSIIKSSSDLSEENRGLLSSISHGSSGTEFLSCEELDERTESTDTLTTTTLPKTGFDFLDNW